MVGRRRERVARVVYFPKSLSPLEIRPDTWAAQRVSHVSDVSPFGFRKLVGSSTFWTSDSMLTARPGSPGPGPSRGYGTGMGVASMNSALFALRWGSGRG